MYAADVITMSDDHVLPHPSFPSPDSERGGLLSTDSRFLNSGKGSGGEATSRLIFLCVLILTVLLLSACASNQPNQTGPTDTPFMLVVTLTPSPTPNLSLGGAADHS